MDAWSVSVEETPGLIWVKRLHTPYPSLEHVRLGFLGLYDQLDRIAEPRPWALVLDIRDSPPARNDEPFEQAHREEQPKLFGYFEARALLVGSAAGMMQLTRIRRRAGGVFEVFNDPAEARAFARAALAAKKTGASSE